MIKKILNSIVILCIFSLLGACSNEDRLKDPNLDANVEAKDFTDEKPDIKAQVDVFEGVYFDLRVYQYTVDMPTSESPLVYCEILISNITESSFDFTINEITMATEESTNLFPTSTAVFIGEGTEAAYYENGEKIITFSFPKEQDLYPIIREITVEGLPELEGNIYYNNRIPGHESGSIINSNIFLG